MEDAAAMEMLDTEGNLGEERENTALGKEMTAAVFQKGLKIAF